MPICEPVASLAAAHKSCRPAGVVIDDSHLSPLEQAKARRARAQNCLDVALGHRETVKAAKKKPPPQPMPKLPPNAFPPQPVAPAAPAAAAPANNFRAKYDKWNDFDDDSD